MLLKLKIKNLRLLNMVSVTGSFINIINNKFSLLLYYYYYYYYLNKSIDTLGLRVNNKKNIEEEEEERERERDRRKMNIHR
jgi:hypothetical protein